MEYDVDIMIYDFDYYIGFIDCEIWLLILDRMDGKNWKKCGRNWKVMEDFGSGGGWRVRGWGGGCCNCNKCIPPNVRVYRHFLAM